MGIFLDSLFFLTLHTCEYWKGLKESVSESLMGREKVAGEGLYKEKCYWKIEEKELLLCCGIKCKNNSL